MSKLWKPLLTVAFCLALIGCGDNAPPSPPVTPAPAIDLRSSTANTSAGDTKPEVKKDDAAKAPDVKPTEVSSPAQQRIAAILEEPTEFAFNETPLTDVVRFVADLHNIPVVIDNEVLSEAAIPADSPVTRTLSGVKLGNTLKMVLEPLKLSYVIEDDMLKIVTAAKVAVKENVEKADGRSAN